MSWRSWFANGKGFYTGKVDDRNLLKFVYENRKYIPEKLMIDFPVIIKRMKTDPFFTLNIEYDEDTMPVEMKESFKNLMNISSFSNLRDALLYIAAEIMHVENNIWFQYMPGMDGCIGEEGAIFLANGAPWSFNPKERSISESDFLALCKKYAEKLGVPEEDIGDIEIEYFG